MKAYLFFILLICNSLHAQNNFNFGNLKTGNQNNLLKKISFEYKLYDWFILPLLVSHDQCSRSVVAVVVVHKW